MQLAASSPPTPSCASTNFASVFYRVRSQQTKELHYFLIEHAGSRMLRGFEDRKPAQLYGRRKRLAIRERVLSHVLLEKQVRPSCHVQGMETLPFMPSCRKTGRSFSVLVVCLG